MDAYPTFPHDRGTIKIHRLGPEFAPAYRQLMLEAYARYPEAFTSSVQEREGLPLDWWERRLQVGDQVRELVWGATEGKALLGVAGLRLETREKVRHKATLFGLYVPDRHRRLGIGGALLAELLTYAKDIATLKVVQLTVTEGNQAAQALYERAGFLTFGVEPMAVAVGGTFVSKVHLWCDVRLLRRKTNCLDGVLG